MGSKGLSGGGVRPLLRTLFAVLASGACALLTGGSTPAYAGAPCADDAGRISTVTRLVKELSEQEGALRAAVDKGDRAALEAMLSERFDLWVGANPDVPTPRAAFINAALAHQDEYRLRVTRRMAVHDFGATAVASFSWSACGAEKPSPLPEIFVVDVWSRAEDGSWKLAVRYADPSGADEPRVPGAADASQPTLPKGY